MNETEYRTRFLNHMSNLQVDDKIAIAEYEAHIESNPGVWDGDSPEDDAEECMSYWAD